VVSLFAKSNQQPKNLNHQTNRRTMNEAKTKKRVYSIQGMTCSGCERTIGRVVGNIEGVTEAKADLDSATVAVTYDPEKVTIDHIKSAVNGIGYKFVGELPATERDAGSEAAR
jgi:copper chaperone CopZ